MSLPPGSLENAAIPGQLYERLRSEYPTDIQTEIQVQMPVGSTDAGPSLVRPAARYIFASDAVNRKLILSSSTLTVNALPPYEGWENLLARFESAASALFDARPELSANALSIRYINRVTIPEQSINTDDYFTIPVRTAEEGTAPFTAISIAVQSSLGDDERSISCTTTFASGEASKAGLVFTIDIELSRALADSDPKRPGDDWDEILDDLHKRENQEFEVHSY